MCLAIPAKVIEKKGIDAVVEIMGLQKEINLMLLPDVELGEYVLVHAGFAIAKTDPTDAQKTLEVIREIGKA
ncbi:MAG: HypC/HybG/HupF family hydrogenase formation chaperone [bacterium]